MGVMQEADDAYSTQSTWSCYWLEKSFKEFYGRYQDLIEKYQRPVEEMVNDSFPR